LWRGIVIAIFLVVVYIQFFSSKAPQEGALRVVICTDCKNSEVRHIIDICDSKDKRNFCPKCGKRYGLAYKCETCSYEFPTINMQTKPPDGVKTMGKFEHAREAARCPNCGSTRTVPMPVKD